MAEGAQPAMVTLVQHCGSADEDLQNWCTAALEGIGPPTTEQIDELALAGKVSQHRRRLLGSNATRPRRDISDVGHADPCRAIQRSHLPRSAKTGRLGVGPDYWGMKNQRYKKSNHDGTTDST